MKIRILLVLALPALCFGCSADYLNRYDSVTLAHGDAVKSNVALHTVDPFNPDSQNTHIESDGQHMAGVVAAYRNAPPSSQPASPNSYDGNCPTPDATAADGKSCGGRAASVKPGGYQP
jgi:hypothetical protein